MQHSESLFQAIKYFGSQQKLANAIGVRRGRVTDWLNLTKTIPLEFAFKIEQVTNGVVKATNLVSKDKSWIIQYILRGAYKTSQVSVSEIYIDDLSLNDSDDIQPLVNDIHLNGLHRPIAVTPNKELCYGLRRLCAFKKLGIKTITAYVIDPIAFLDFANHIYGLISHCTITERAAIGRILEKIINRWKINESTCKLISKNDLHLVRPDLDIDKLPVQEFVARLLYLGDRKTYRSIKRIMQCGTPELIAEFDKGNINVREATNILIRGL